MLEESDVIDIITQIDGNPVLIIVDAAITPDKAERRQLLQAKLFTYAQAIISGEIELVTDPAKTKIRVVCADQPNDVYEQITAIGIKDAQGQSLSIPVEFQHMDNQFS